MALINDPDDLNQGVEVVFDTANKTIQLLEAGNLSADGATIKAIYSFTKEEWIADSTKVRHKFPFTPITDEFYELKDGWNWADQSTINLLRRGGFLVRDLVGNVTEHWAGIAILGSEADDQIYYDIGDGTTDFVYLGNTAEVVQVISDPTGDGSYVLGFNRSANITAYNRQQGQIYSVSSTSAAGEASLLAPKLFSLTLNTGNDLNVVALDSAIAANAPYTGMDVTFHDTAQSRTIGGSDFDFGVIIDANGGTLEQVYEFTQYIIRQNADIDDDASILLGQVADQLLGFVGGAGDGTGALQTLSVTNPDGGGSGVFIDNFAASDTNRVTFTDNGGALRQFPFIASLDINFNPALRASSDAIYRVFFSDANGNDFDDSDAIIVEDEANNPMAGTVSGAASVSFTFDYDANVQGGRTAGTDAAITIVAIGSDDAQHVIAESTIARSTTNSVTLVAALERNYENPA